MKFRLGRLVLIFLALQIADGLKVLGVIPFVSKSHFAIGHAVVKSLHDVGHEVTVISPFPQKKPIVNYTDIVTTDIMEEFNKDFVMNAFEFEGMSAMIGVVMMYSMGSALFQKYMKHPEIQKLLESDQKFDVCVFEVFASDAFMGFADHFDCTIISYTTFGAVNWIDLMTSNQSPYSYVPNPYGDFTDKMTFTQRLTNTFYYQIDSLAYRAYHIPNQRGLYEKHFPNAKKSFDDVRKSSAIIFVNNHVSSSSARPYQPNVIEIGGVHVQPAKSLPKDIKGFLDSANNGAILFSMGSIVQAVQWPVEKREALVKAFSKLKQKVIWKYENETLPNKPENVMISSWIPQRDILAHPNIKVFITHGGLLGTTEALVEGVPVLGIPVFGDQKMNMAKAVARGYGVTVPLAEVTEENISNALNELLSNPKYKENAKVISSRFTDRPMKPRDSVVYWTEYAVRHKGAPHLRAAGNSLSFIEFHLIDVYATIFSIGAIAMLVAYKILKIIASKCLCGKKKEKTY